jgi:hypothetical protein
MPEIDELFTLAASDFETAEAYFKEMEDVLSALKAKLDDCSERLAELAYNESPLCVKSDKSIDSTPPPDRNNAEGEPKAFDDELEIYFNHLAKLSTEKIVSNSPTINSK